DPATFRWKMTRTVLCWPGSALSGPDVAPVRPMSGLSHHTPPPLWAPPSPVVASMNTHVSAASAGSLAIAASLSNCSLSNYRVAPTVWAPRLRERVCSVADGSCRGGRPAHGEPPPPGVG